MLIEKDGDAWCDVPDLPSFVAVGESREEMDQLIAKAAPLSSESLREHGEPVPTSSTGSTNVRIA